MITTVILDMYGVIIKESKGRLIPYALAHFPEAEHERIGRLIHDEQLFTRSALGEISSDEFLGRLGFADPQFTMRDYLDQCVTFDEGFLAFAERFKGRVRFALLSNDVSEWSRYIVARYGLDAYLCERIVSGDVHCRKPDSRIYQIALERLGVGGDECAFVDNSVANLDAAARFGMSAVLFNTDGVQYGGATVYAFSALAGWLEGRV